MRKANPAVCVVVVVEIHTVLTMGHAETICFSAGVLCVLCSVSLNFPLWLEIDQVQLAYCTL